MGFDSRIEDHIQRDPLRRQVAPFVVSGKTQTGEWINRLYARVLALEEGGVIGGGDGGTVDPNAPPPTNYHTGNLPLADALKIGDWTAGQALPSLGDLKVQKDYNHWIYGAMANDSLRIDNIEEREKDYAVRSWVQTWVAQYYAKLDHKHPELAVDLNGYATEEWVLEQIEAIEIPELGSGGLLPELNGEGHFDGPYATEAWVNEQGFIKVEELGAELSPYAEKEWVQDWFVSINDFEEAAYSAARISEKETLVWAGQKQAPPIPSDSGSIGWAYKSAGDGTKAFWALWSQDRDAPKQLTIADVYSYSLVMTGKGQSPFLQVYTKRKNDGNDSGSTYRSRICYSLQGELPKGLVTLVLATSSADTPHYANLERLELSRESVLATGELTEEELEVQPQYSVGPGEPDEEITKVCLSTNSAALEGDYDFMVSALVLHTRHGTYDTQLEFTGSSEAYDDTELVERIVALEEDESVATLSDVIHAGNILQPGEFIRFSSNPDPIAITKGLSSFIATAMMGTIPAGYGRIISGSVELDYINPEIPIQGDADNPVLGDEVLEGIYKFDTAAGCGIYSEDPNLTKGAEPIAEWGLYGIGYTLKSSPLSFWVNPWSFNLQGANACLKDQNDVGYLRVDGEKAKIDTETGKIEANEFVGDGSKLTNVGSVDVNWESLPELK